MSTFTTPELTFLTIILGGRLEAARRSERGASAVEWAIITVILIGIATGLGVAIKKAVDDKATQINLG